MKRKIAGDIFGYMPEIMRGIKVYMILIFPINDKSFGELYNIIGMLVEM